MTLAISTLNSKYIHPSVALRILSNDLNNNNIKHDVLEYTIKEDRVRIANELSKYNILGLSCYIWNIEQIKELIKELRKLNEDQIIILGGPEVSFVNKEDLNDYDFNYIVCGEGEKIFVELINDLNRENKIINECIIKKDNNIITMNTDTNYVSIEYASPLTNDFSNIDINNQLVYLETSRGCPYQCAYCQASLDNNVRNFDLDYILKLIDEVNEKKVKLVKFLDRTFNFDVKRTNKILEYIIANDTGLTTYQFEITGELLDFSSIEIINKKARKDLFRFEIGIQSTNDKANKAINRYQNFEKLEQVIKEIQEGNKIVLHLDLIAGLPFEDLEGFKETFDKVFALNAEELQLGFLKLLKGTKLNNYVKEYNYIFDKKAPFEIISNSFLSNEDLRKIDDVEHGLNNLYNQKKAEVFTKHIINKYKISPFEYFYSLGKDITRKMQVHQVYELMINSGLIKDEKDLIKLYENYYLDKKQRQKKLSNTLNKKEILHKLVERENLKQNEVFTNSCVEKINDNKYFVYLLNKQRYYIIER